MKPARVQCRLCPNHCLIEAYERGNCKVRINVDGKLYSLVYGKPCALHVDPIEKKPLYHFLPATRIFSLATAGCCLSCEYCQNWEISQAWPEDIRNHDLMPDAVIREAQCQHCLSIAYTYTEPTIFFEYMIDTAALAKEKGLRNVSVTCGYINPKPLDEACKVIDAANVDLKGFTEEFYHRNSRGKLKPVMDAIVQMKKNGVHVEITNLIVPSRNDDMKMIERMCQWIAREVGRDTPLHFSRFHPDHKLRHLPPTPVKTLLQARKIAVDQGIRFVYVGNVPGNEFNSTFCPGCAKKIIDRRGYHIVSNDVDEQTGQCKHCQTPIAGVWK